jgi:hypothetical protein
MMVSVGGDAGDTRETSQRASVHPSMPAGRQSLYTAISCPTKLSPSGG